MQIDRPELLNRLIQAEQHHLVKIITGIRRCGKSYLLFKIFKNHLKRSDITDDHIICINLEKPTFTSLRNPIALAEYLDKHIPTDGKRVFVLIDEIQLVQKTLPEGVNLSRIHPDDQAQAFITFYDVLNGLLDKDNVSTYVTGSNSRMLSSDIASEFRGRSEVIHMTPLAFSEFLACGRSFSDRTSALQEYLTFGGLPECVLMDTPEEKRSYLEFLHKTIYLKDIAERHHLKSDEALTALTDVIMSTIGGLTNPQKLSDTMKTVLHCPCSRPTVCTYLDYLEDAFLIQKARKYDVRGRNYFDSPMKYYATDLGLRNIRINNRQNEMTHLMENAIYNELLRSGYAVDVGEVSFTTRTNNVSQRRTHEIDFVVNRGYERIYLQSAWMIPNEEKMQQETFSLKHTGDNFRKIVIDGHPLSTRYLDADGIGHISLIDFLLNPHAIERL